jgi:hypothetical protein
MVYEIKIIQDRFTKLKKDPTVYLVYQVYLVYHTGEKTEPDVGSNRFCLESPVASKKRQISRSGAGQTLCPFVGQVCVEMSQML